MKTGNVDVLVVGAGPAGLAAAVSAHDSGAQVLLLEREARLGGTLKQCIHDGFGLQCFGEQLSGPEYAERYIDELHLRGIEAHTLTFVTKVGRNEGGYAVHAVSRDGISVWNAKALVLATGCRQRTARQVFIHGTRSAGVFTAGTAQHFVNLLGLMPGKRCVILGSGDTGLIMARRLTLEGAEVLGVYEAKAKPSGQTRNLHQCLYDYGIPLYLSHTVTRIFGVDRVEAVEISEVDENMVPIAGTARRLDCDTLILSVGLIPENELAQSIGVQLDARTGGPVCDGQCMTSEDGVFSCGNALHVNDLVDHVSQNAELVGKAAAHYAAEPKPRTLIEVVPREGLQYVVPQRLNLNESNKATKVYFRVREEEKNCTLHITADGKEILQKRYPFVRPPEMGILTVDFDGCAMNENSRVELRLECGNRKGDDAK